MNLDKRLLRQARQSRLALALTVGLGFIAGLLTVWQAGAISRVIAQVFLGGRSLAGVAGVLAILLGVILLRAVVTWGAEVSAHAVASRIKLSLRLALLRHIQALGPAYTRSERSGELSAVLNEGVESLDAYFSQYLPQLVLAALTPLTFLVFVFPRDPLSALVLLLTAPLIPLFMALVGGAAKRLTRRQWTLLSRINAYFLDVLQGLTTLKQLGRSRAQVEVIAETSERYRRATMQVLRLTFLSALTLELVATISTAVVAVEIGLRLLYGRLAFEQALFVLLLAPEFYLPLRALGARFHAGMAGVAAAKRIFEILETPAAGGSQPAAVDNPAESAEFLQADIRFEAVRFTYPAGRTVLDGIDLCLPAGQVTALVGPSGGGKSTLADLLLRFAAPTAGRIMLGDTPLAALDPHRWRAQLAWVPQQPHLLHDTVLANIRLGDPQAGLERVVWAAQQAQADDFIRRLPQGYHTPVGERGARLSSGQAQRIALARAFLKDAPLLILDEPSAHLDPGNEAQLTAALQRLLRGRTALIIAHRLNTVAAADRVVVLDRGKIAGVGAPHEFLARDGVFQRLAYAASPVFDGDPASTADVAQSFRQVSSAPDAPNLPLRAVLPRLLRLVAPLSGWIALSTLLGFLTVASGLGLLGASAYIISAAALQPSIADLQLAIVGVRFFGISRALFRYLERLVSHYTTFGLLARLRVWFYRSLEPLAPARLLRYRSGDLLARIQGDINALEDFYVRSLAPPLVALCVALAAGLYLARFDPSLAFVLWLFMALAGIVVPLLVRWLARRPARRLVEDQAALSAALVDGVQGLADLLAFNAAARQTAHIQALARALARSQGRLARLHGLQAALGLSLTNLALWTALVLAIPLVHGGRLDGVYLAVLVLVVYASFEALLPLPAAAQRLETHLTAAARLFEIVDARPEVLPPPEHVFPPRRSSPPERGPRSFDLLVEGLRFAYPPALVGGQAETRGGGVPWALDGLDLRLRQGGRLALVGPSGAGKSTMFNLLLRFWEYHHGRILLGGQDLRRYDPQALRLRMAVVSQRAYLFSASLYDNLRLARPAASQAQIDAALQAAQLGDFVASLPQGGDTWVGEHGARLSGGERQRLAIARALLRDPPLLLLDEPAAHLDPYTERALLSALERLMDGRTTLLVTHRLIGLERMDQILVLDRGRVIERGTHTHLLNAHGLYRRMWDLQNTTLPTS